MDNSTPTKQPPEKSGIFKKVSHGRMVIGILIMTVLPAVLLIVSSGRINWIMAWVYIGITTTFAVGSRIIMIRINPDLVAERANFSDHKNAMSWDKKLMPFVAIIGPIIMLILAGLDNRFKWSPNLPLTFKIVALAFLTLSYVVSTWATTVNKYFSAIVRIQREREHTVVTVGPYQYIRHPGYAAGIISNCTIPLILNSLWALVPAVLISCLVIVRTALEDRTLQDKLEGYSDYAGRVRYRLLPGIW